MTQSPNRPLRLTRLTRRFAGVAIAVCLFAGPANATWIVNDPMSMAKALQEYAEQAKRWTETIKQYQMQLEHYQQQLIKLQRLQFGDSTMADNFPERPQDYGLEDSCPGASQSGINGLMNQFKALAPDMNGSAVDEQMKVCARIVMAKNAQYNETVRMLKRLIQRNEQFKQVQSQRDGVGTSQGALSANDNEVRRFVAQNSMDLDYWQAQMKAYDAYIVALKDDQSRLARRALDGNKNILGQVIQAGVLAGALSK